jgi:ribosomal subunit interface protein
MELPLQITFHQLDRSDAIAAKVREAVNKLERHFDGIQSCRVAIEALHHHHRSTGNPLRVRVELAVPGQQLVAIHGADEDEAGRDPYVAIRDAFDAIRRQLDDYTARLRGEVKSHKRPKDGT